MGYHIEYDKGTRAYEIRKKYPLRVYALTAGCFLLFLVLTLHYWPGGREVLQECLIPGDNRITFQALENMTDSLRAGSSLGDAVTAFCREILDGANYPG